MLHNILTIRGALVRDPHAWARYLTDRVSPRLIDLLAALATGAVGAFAMVRADVSDTLPGVAIAISLVPPLAVVGLSLESGAPEQALGASCCSAPTSARSSPPERSSSSCTGSGRRPPPAARRSASSG